MKKIAQASLALMIFVASPAIVNGAVNTPAKPSTVNKIENPNYVFPIKNKMKITANSYATLTDINLDSAEESNVLTYVIKIYNGDKTPINLIDYWTRVKSKSSGVVYSAAIATEDKNKPKILSKSYQEIKFFAKVDKSVKINDLKIEVVKWDFSSTDYIKKLGEVSIPKDFTYLVKPILYKTINVMDVPIKTNIKDYTLTNVGENNLFSLTVQYQNVGKLPLKAVKTKYFLIDDVGIKYQLNTDANSDLSIQPWEKKTISLGASIPSAAKSKNWILQIDQEDETAKVNLGLVSFTVPKSTTNNVSPIKTEKLISVNNKQVGVEVKYGSVAGNSDRKINLSVSYINRDTSTVDLPKYNYELHVAGGYSFPLVNKETATSTALNSMQRKTLSLNALIPANIYTDDMQLVIVKQIGGTQPAADAPATESFNVPVAVFNLKEISSSIPNEPIYMDTSSGTYLVSLEEVQRLPWTETDIIAAHFKIKNLSFATSVPVPNLLGSMTIDGISGAEADTKYIQPDNILTIEPNSTIDAYVISKIPYISDYSNVQVGLQEKVNEDIREVATFSKSREASQYPSIAVNAEYQVDSKGKRAKVKARKTNVYAGMSGNVIYSELDVQNLETRQSNLTKMVAYYTSGNGDYYKANISQSELPTQAGGKSLVTAWANIPRSVSVSNLKLMVGQGVLDNKLAAAKDEPTAFVNAALFELPASSTAVNRTLLNMDYFPYTFSIRSFAGSLTGGSSLNVEMDYILNRELDYDLDKYEHKVLLQLEDAQTHRILEREVSIGTDLTEGSHTFNYSVNDSAFEDRKAGAFTINVYDVFQGQKRLVGTQSMYYSSKAPIE
jgi:hypothetical protein